MNWNLNFIYSTNIRALSTNPIDSDSISNLLHMENVVGTLVKIDHLGKITPYLSETWNVSDHGKVWKFDLKSNLKCDDGEIINAKNFAKVLIKNILYYKQKKGNLPVFQNLSGYEINNLELGIIDDNNSIVFNFNIPVYSGFLEFLTMPYFGYYCQKNYLGNEWKSNEEIISSGAYKIKKFDNANLEVFLEKRQDWFDLKENSPKNVKIIQNKLKDALKNENRTIIYTNLEDNPDISENYKVFNSVKEISISLVLSPYLKFFSDIENRKWFRNKLEEAKKNIKLNDKSVIQSEFFYAQLESNISRDKRIIEPKDLPSEISLIMTDHLTTQQKNYILNLLNFIFENKTKIKSDVINKNDLHWFEKYTSNKNYDIRIAGVSAGSGFQNWAIEMMFCSNLGISFPDPSQNICKLVKHANKENIDLEIYKNSFNQSLYSDAVVLPLFQKGLSWLYTKDIDFNFSPSSGPLRFDLIKLEK